MTFFLDQLVNALLLGGIYALIAVGYTMVYGIVKLINFAHGEIYMFGAFFGVILISSAGLPFWVALLFSMAGCAVLGFLIDFLAYRAVRNAPRLAALITAVGVSLFLQNLAMLIWGSEPRAFPELNPTQIIYIESQEQQEVKKTFLQPLQASLLHLRDHNYESVPYLADYSKAVEDLQQLKNSRAEKSEIRQAEKYLVLIKEEIPRVTTCDLRQYNKRPALQVSFASGTSTAGINRLLTAAQTHFLEQSGLSLPAKTETLENIFKQPFIGERGKTDSVFVPYKFVFIWVVTLTLLILLDWVIQHTRVGKAMRACSQDKTAAALMGINVSRIISFTFMIGSAMAAVAGVSYALYLGSQVSFRMGVYPGVIAFCAAVLGGIGNLRGAFAGGLIMGLVQVGARAYLCPFVGISGGYSIAFAFAVLILVILIRPAGLFPSLSIERA